jgi:4-amino-4-deoxy-L-arabinose transferase-like glycosyltransferase
VTEPVAKSIPPALPDVRRWTSRAISPAVAVVLTTWLILLLAALAARPLLPIDETRYASVAWEMWRTGDFLVPHLNGHPYSDKPPLLFWLITVGWSIIGPVEIWARLIGPLVGIASIVLTVMLARRLWPDRADVARAAPLILAGTLVWAVYSTLLLFDTLLTACVLLGLIGLVDARRGRGGFVRFAVSIGLGLLAKGPVVFVHLLPAAVMSPWWDVRHRSPPGTISSDGGMTGWRWALAMSSAMLAGAGLALAWAIPAAVSGGPMYARAIFIGQTAGRMVHSFAHERPAWWYAPNLLWMTLPWIAWPSAWRAVRTAWRRRSPSSRDTGLRFCAAVAVPTLVVLSAVSGKQVHYLLPEMPILALVMSRLLAGDRQTVSDTERGVIARVPAIAAGTLVVVAVAHVVAAPYVRARYDTRSVAAHLSALERGGAPIAHEGRYAGEYTYVGRLRRPLAEVRSDSVAGWLAGHPNGRVVTYAAVPNAPGPGVVELVHRAGHRFILVRSARHPREVPGVPLQLGRR